MPFEEPACRLVGESPVVAPPVGVVAADLADAGGSSQHAAAGLKDTVQLRDRRLDVEDELQCLRQHDAVEGVVADARRAGQIRDDGRGRRLACEVKYVALRDAGTAEALGVGALRDLEHMPLDRGGALPEEPLHVVAIDGDSPIEPEHATDRFGALQATEVDAAHRDRQSAPLTRSFESCSRDRDGSLEDRWHRSLTSDGVRSRAAYEVESASEPLCHASGAVPRQGGHLRLRPHRCLGYHDERNHPCCRVRNAPTVSDHPLFSIVTVCLNAEAHIAEAIESVLAQSCADYEYLVVDGGSTDGTLGVLGAYESRVDGRLRWVSERDDGLYDAMNKGLAPCSLRRRARRHARSPTAAGHRHATRTRRAPRACRRLSHRRRPGTRSRHSSVRARTRSLRQCALRR